MSSLIKLQAVQPRAIDDPSFVKDIKVEVETVGGNTSNMNTVLIFEGVGGKFGYEDGSDMVGGTTHGLKGAHKAKARKMTPCRVPYDILKDKSKYFIEALAGFDNHKDTFSYDPTWLDGKKLILKLHAETGTDPMSETAAEQV